MGTKLRHSGFGREGKGSKTAEIQPVSTSAAIVLQVVSPLSRHEVGGVDAANFIALILQLLLHEKHASIVFGKRSDASDLEEGDMFSGSACPQTGSDA